MINHQLRSFLWCVATAATFACTHLLLAALLGRVVPNQALWVQGTGQIVLSAVCLVVAAAFVGVLHRDDFWQGFTKQGSGPVVRWQSILLALLVGLSLQFPLAELANWLQYLFPASHQYFAERQKLLQWTSAREFLLLSFTIAAVIPFAEEVVFRGLILRKLLGQWSTTGAVLISALCFALAHLEPVAIIYAFFAGSLIGWAYSRSGSLWIACAVHAGVNWLPIILSQKLILIPGFNTISPEIQHINLWLVISSLFMCGLATYAMHRMFPAQRHE